MRGKYPVSALCRNLDLAPSSYYYEPAAAVGDDRELRAAIRRIAGKYPTYGSRRIAWQLALAPYFITAGRHRVRKLMAEMGLRIKRRLRSTTNSKHGLPLYPNLVKGLTATRPDQIWVADITHIGLPGAQAYLAIVMDIFTRQIRGWRLSKTSGQTLSLGALNMAVRAHRRVPEIHHSDRGGQYAAKAYTQLLRSAGTRISMTAAGKPSENGYAERVIRTIKEEEVYLSDYQSLEEARRQIGHFIDQVYAHERIHSALGYATPAEHEAGWRENTPLGSGILCPVL